MISVARHIHRSQLFNESDMSAQVAHAEVELLNMVNENQQPFYIREVQALTSCFLLEEGQRV